MAGVNRGARARRSYLAHGSQREAKNHTEHWRKVSPPSTICNGRLVASESRAVDIGVDASCRRLGRNGRAAAQGRALDQLRRTCRVVSSHCGPRASVIARVAGRPSNWQLSLTVSDLWDNAGATVPGPRSRPGLSVSNGVTWSVRQTSCFIAPGTVRTTGCPWAVPNLVPQAPPKTWFQ